MKCAPRWLGVGVLALALGCGGSGPKLYDVSGTVTWNGRSLPEGDIIFYAADGQLAPDAGKIVDGKFHFKAKAGAKRVEITAIRPVPGKIDPATGQPVRESYLPPRYNAESTLTATVGPDGANHFPFVLTEKPSR